MLHPGTSGFICVVRQFAAASSSFTVGVDGDDEEKDNLSNDRLTRPTPTVLIFCPRLWWQ